jgi:Bacterial Ig domain
MKQFLFALALCCIVACSKDGGDKQMPVIALNSPTANQQFPAFSPVVISGNVTDEGEIHEVHIEVTNKTNSIAVLHVQDHVDARSYNISETFTAQAATTYKIHIEAHDHAGNIAVVDFEVRGN